MPNDPLAFRVKARDLDAFRLLVRRYIDRAYAIALCILGAQAKVDDTIQRVFLELWERPSYFLDGPEPLMVSLFRQVIACSRAVQDREIGWSTSGIAREGIIPEAGNQYYGLTAQAQGAIACLPVDEQLILLLSCFEELSLADIANIVRIENSTVISTLARHRKHLRQ